MELHTHTGKKTHSVKEFKNKRVLELELGSHALTSSTINLEGRFQESLKI